MATVTADAVVGMALSVALRDEAWHLFGFRKRPRWTGSAFRWMYSEASWQILMVLLRNLATVSTAVQLHELRARLSARQFLDLAEAVLANLWSDEHSGPYHMWTGFRYPSAVAARKGLAGLLELYCAAAFDPVQLGAAFLREMPTDQSAAGRWFVAASQFPTSPAFHALRRYARDLDVETLRRPQHSKPDPSTSECAERLLRALELRRTTSWEPMTRADRS